MRASGRLLPLITAAIVLANPLGVLAAHTRCLEDSHACGKVVLVDRCCCDLVDARTGPATTQTLPSAPPVFVPMPVSAAAPPTASAMLRVPHYPPLAGHVSLNTLFAILLI
jgi:hypothetical protein